MAASKTPTLVAELVDLDRQLEELSERRDAVAKDLIDRLGIGGTVETDEARVTVVQNLSEVVDFETLKSMHPTWARKVTKSVLNTAKFNLLRKAGEVPEDIIPLIKVKASAAFLRVTPR